MQPNYYTFSLSKTARFCCIALAVICVGMLDSPASAAKDTASELQAEVAAMNQWLGGGAKAEGWRRYLQLNILDTQAAKGNQADPNTLQSLLNRFNEDEDGMDHPAFENVRYALRNHLEQLQAVNNVALPKSLVDSQYDFEPMDKEAFQSICNAAVYDLKMLKLFMKKNFSSRPRALAFYELRPDETIKEINGLKIAAKEGRSKRVINEEIEQLEDQREKIAERVRMLNEQADKINDWLNNIQRPEGVKPPGPDNGGDGDEEPQQPELKPLDLNDPEKQSQERRKESIEVERRSLSTELDGLNQQIEKREKELEELETARRKRLKKIRAVVGSLRARGAAFEKLQSKYRDIYFASARDSLKRVTDAFIFANDPNIEKRFSQQVELLVENYSKLDDPRQRRASAETGAGLGWLESVGHAPDVIAAIRRRHSLPNIEVDFSGNLLQQAVSRNISRVERVDDLVLGRLIKGIAHSNGNVSLQLLDDPNQIHARVQLSGSLSSNTYSRSGPFTAYTGATGQYQASRNFFANVGGLFADDVSAAVNLDSFFNSIDSNLKLVQRVALKTYRESKDRSESISSGRLKDRIEAEFVEETGAALDSGKKQFSKLLKRQQAVAGLLPKFYAFTSNNRVNVIGSKTTMVDLAAPVSPDRSSGSIYGISPDIRVRLHETMLSNFVSPIFAGKRFSNEEIAERVAELGGEIKTGDAEDDEAFEITFDNVRPIQFEFDEDSISVSVFGRRFKQDRNSITGGLVIRVKFKLVRGFDNVIRFTQTDKITVDFSNPDRKSAKLVAFRKFLEDRLNKLVAENEAIAIELPQNLIPVDQIDALKDVALAKNLRLVQLRMIDGWLYGAWNTSEYGPAVDLQGIWMEESGRSGQMDHSDFAAPPIPE